MQKIKTKSVTKLLVNKGIPYYTAESLYLANFKNYRLTWLDEQGIAKAIKFTQYFDVHNKLSGFCSIYFISSFKDLKNYLQIIGADEPYYKKRFTYSGLD